MPVDKTFSDAVLDTFRNMLKDTVEVKKLEGEPVEKMKEVMARMEQLAIEMDDAGEFSMKLSTEGLYLEFSNQYTKALMNASKVESYDDESLLKNAHKAMLDSYNYHKDRPESKHLVKPIKRIVEIGESGVSYPVYLRMAEEEGLYDEMKSGQMRPVIEFELDVARKMYDPLRTEMFEKILAAWDQLSKEAYYGHPDPTEYSILRNKIEWEYAPRIAEWDAIFSRWDRLLSLAFDWLDSFCSFAPYDERWAGDTNAITRKNIRRTQECGPGFFKARENIFKAYFNLSWTDIFTHPTWLNEVSATRIWYADEVIELLKEIYPSIVPGGTPPSSVISKREALEPGKKYISQAYMQRWGNKDNNNPFNFTDFAKFAEAGGPSEPQP